MWQSICGCAMRSVAKLNGRGSSSPGWRSRFREIDGSAIEAAGRAGLEAGELEAAGGEAVAERFGGAVAGAAAPRLGFAGVHDRFEERAGGQHDRLGAIQRIAAATTPARDVPLCIPAIVRVAIAFHHLLAQRQIRLRLDPVLHGELVQFSCRPAPAASAWPGPWCD